MEVLFGLGLFAMAILLVFGVFPTANRSLAAAKNLAVANDLARLTMEQALARAEGAGTRAEWDLLTSEIPAPITVPVVVNGVAASTLFNPRLDVTVQNSKPGDLYDRKLLVVTVNWEEGPITRSTVMETYVARADVPFP